MYSFVNAIVKPLSGGGQWVNADISQMTMSAIFKTYGKGYAILSNPLLSANVSLDLSAIRNTYGGLAITFSDFLTQNGNKALNTSTTLPTISTRYARYKDAFRAGYKATPVDPNTSPDAALPQGAKTWLYLSKDDTDFTAFGKYMIATVNGFFHRVESNSSGAWVVDGMQSNILCNQNQLGLLNFQDIGALTYLPITANMIYSPEGSEQMRYRTNVNLGVDISEKSLMLCIAGYLHVVDNKTFRKVNDTTVQINFNNYPVFERYEESRKYLNYDSLPFSRSTNNDALLSVDDFLSDANLKALLTLSQSFFVIVDNADLYETRETVQATKMPGLFISYKEPKWPLIVGNGRVADYWSILEDGQYSLSVLDSATRNWQFNTTDPRKLMNLDDTVVPGDECFFPNGQFLKIGCDIS